MKYARTMVIAIAMMGINTILVYACLMLSQSESHVSFVPVVDVEPNITIIDFDEWSGDYWCEPNAVTITFGWKNATIEFVPGPNGVDMILSDCNTADVGKIIYNCLMFKGESE